MNIFDKMWTKENTDFTRRILAKVEGDKWRDEIYQFLNDRTANIWLVLAYLSRTLEVGRYLEVGTRRGYSLAVVAGRQPKAALWSFDLWISNYAGVHNPGPDFVREQLARVGHKGPVEFVVGDSHKTLPQFRPDELFPLILVDGDHSEAGSYQDITDCLRLLAPGGYLVVDDMQDPAVARAFERASAGLEANAQDRVGLLYRG